MRLLVATVSRERRAGRSPARARRRRTTSPTANTTPTGTCSGRRPATTTPAAHRRASRVPATSSTTASRSRSAAIPSRARRVAPSTALPCATIDPNGVVIQLGYDSGTGDLTSSSTPGREQRRRGRRDHLHLRRRWRADERHCAGRKPYWRDRCRLHNDEHLQRRRPTAHGDGRPHRRRQSPHATTQLQLRRRRQPRSSMINPRGKETDYTFDADDQRVLVTDPDSQSDPDLLRRRRPRRRNRARRSASPRTPSPRHPARPATRPATATSSPPTPPPTPTTNSETEPSSPLRHRSTTPAAMRQPPTAYDAAGLLLSTTAPPSSYDTGASDQVTTYTYDARWPAAHQDCRLGHIGRVDDELLLRPGRRQDRNRPTGRKHLPLSRPVRPRLHTRQAPTTRPDTSTTPSASSSQRRHPTTGFVTSPDLGIHLRPGRQRDDKRGPERRYDH